MKHQLLTLTLIKLDLDNEKNLILVCNINTWTSLKEMEKSLSLKQEEKRKFLRECELAAIASLKRMQERSPLKNSVCRNASSLSPNKMATEKDACVLKFNNLAESFSKAKLISPDDADKAKAEYDNWSRRRQTYKLTPVRTYVCTYVRTYVRNAISGHSFIRIF